MLKTNANMDKKEQQKDPNSKTTLLEKSPICFSWRLVLSLVGFFGLYMLYAVRVNLSIGIVCMVKFNFTSSGNSSVGGTNVTTPSPTEDICEDRRVPPSGVAGGELDWPRNLQGLILSSFFWGYIVTQLPGGYLSGKYGGKHIFGIGLLISGMLTLLVPVLSRAHWGLLMAQRILMGLLNGAAFPTLHSMWGKWAPPLERSILITLCYSGMAVGGMLTTVFSGMLCQYGGWPSVFYVTGGTTVLWWIFWQFLVYNSPEEHPRISPKEKEYIETTIANDTGDTTDMPVPWCEIMKSLPAWAILVAHFCANWGLYTTVTGGPMYLNDVLKFSITENGLFAAIPAVVGLVATVGSGFIADILRSKCKVRTVVVRKVMQILGTFGPGLLTIWMGFLDCDQRALAVVLFSLSSGFVGCVNSGYVINHLDIAPEYAGILYGLSNTLATVTGIVAPIVIGQLTPNQTREEWQVVLFMSAAIGMFGGLFFAIFASGQVQPWAKRRDGQYMYENNVDSTSGDGSKRSNGNTDSVIYDDVGVNENNIKPHVQKENQRGKTCSVIYDDVGSDKTGNTSSGRKENQGDIVTGENYIDITNADTEMYEDVGEAKVNSSDKDKLNKPRDSTVYDEVGIYTNTKGHVNKGLELREEVPQDSRDIYDEVGIDQKTSL